MSNKSTYKHLTKLAKGRQYIAKKRMAMRMPQLQTGYQLQILIWHYTYVIGSQYSCYYY